MSSSADLARIRMRDIFASSWLPYLASICAGLMLWQLISTQLPGVIFASPVAVADHLVGAFASGDLPARFANSLRHMILGLGLALLVAVPLGMLMGRSETAFHMCNPVLTALFAIPSVAFVPFLIIWFGVFFEARVALVFVMCVFDILITVTAGARNIEPRVIQAARSFGANRRTTFFSVLLPASYPFLMTALRIGTIRAVNGMITAELFFAAVNLGEYMEDASSVFDSAAMLSVVFCLSLFGLLAQELVKWAEARLLPWHVRS
ncbi:ABC transporter permease [Oceanomicrobium pacificus]|uniref:ABC transporter permease subunit n=1 Tax=Oceanomicrobium pacificus TaxID=2692916 RepID=A0A6B0TNB8_9RHOB|nr:ABC transporter permease [Oceanomicrobium pacificus]MXU66037.1 ABC transporter permease subunit [Oceanomicrobium pacificus]